MPPYLPPQIPDQRDVRIEPAPVPGEYIVRDRDGRRVGTIETMPDGRQVYRDFQTGQRRN